MMIPPGKKWSCNLLKMMECSLEVTDVIFIILGSLTLEWRVDVMDSSEIRVAYSTERLLQIWDHLLVRLPDLIRGITLNLVKTCPLLTNRLGNTTTYYLE